VSTNTLQIAGLSVRLHDPDAALARLDATYDAFEQRLAVYRRDGRNVVLCRAGCSHCCRSGGFFAITLVEALRLCRAANGLPEPQRNVVTARAGLILDSQQELFAQVPGPPDRPGERDEAVFSARVSHVTRSHPTCPLLGDGELCSIYADRPVLCRAYGYATDAYAVQSAQTIVFRSLCVLYQDVRLHDYVRAKELRARLTAISRDLAGGRHVGRFTLPEAVLAEEAGDE